MKRSPVFQAKQSKYVMNWNETEGPAQSYKLVVHWYPVRCSGQVIWQRVQKIQQMRESLQHGKKSCGKPRIHASHANDETGWCSQRKLNLPKMPLLIDLLNDVPECWVLAFKQIEHNDSTCLMKASHCSQLWSQNFHRWLARKWSSDKWSISVDVDKNTLKTAEIVCLLCSHTIWSYQNNTDQKASSSHAVNYSMCCQS